MSEVAHVEDEDGFTHLRPNLEGLGVPDDEAVGVRQRDREFDYEETLQFLQHICDGWGELEAGLAIAWSPAKIKRFLANKERQELIWAIHEAENESVERAIKRTALAGNPSAQKLWAMNKMAHRGWADRKSVHVSGEIDHGVVVAVRQALEDRTRVLVESNSEEGIAALQRASGLTDDIIDAEVIIE